MFPSASGVIRASPSCFSHEIARAAHKHNCRTTPKPRTLRYQFNTAQLQVKKKIYTWYWEFVLYMHRGVLDFCSYRFMLHTVLSSMTKKLTIKVSATEHAVEVYFGEPDEKLASVYGHTGTNPDESVNRGPSHILSFLVTSRTAPRRPNLPISVSWTKFRCLLTEAFHSFQTRTWACSERPLHCGLQRSSST